MWADVSRFTDDCSRFRVRCHTAYPFHHQRAALRFVYQGAVSIAVFPRNAWGAPAESLRGNWRETAPHFAKRDFHRAPHIKARRHTVGNRSRCWVIELWAALALVLRPRPPPSSKLPKPRQWMPSCRRCRNRVHEVRYDTRIVGFLQFAEFTHCALSSQRWRRIARARVWRRASACSKLWHLRSATELWPALARPGQAQKGEGPRFPRADPTAPSPRGDMLDPKGAKAQPGRGHISANHHRNSRPGRESIKQSDRVAHG